MKRWYSRRLRAGGRGSYYVLLRGKIIEIDLVADPERVRRLDLAILNDGGAAGEGMSILGDSVRLSHDWGPLS
jgi:hypothetical protein